MTNRTYLVISTSSGLKLRQQPEMKEPTPYNKKYHGLADWADYYNADMNDYNQHIADCEKNIIDIAPEVTCWKVGDVVKEGEFETKRGKQIHFTDQQQWQEMNNSEKDYYFEQLAIPNEPQEKESELIEIISETLYSVQTEKGQHLINTDLCFEIASQLEKDLMQHYHITKK